MGALRLVVPKLSCLISGGGESLFRSQVIDQYIVNLLPELSPVCLVLASGARVVNQGPNLLPGSQRTFISRNNSAVNLVHIIYVSQLSNLGLNTSSHCEACCALATRLPTTGPLGQWSSSQILLLSKNVLWHSCIMPVIG